MQPPQQHSWINLTELKSQIIRNLGPEKSKQYFDYLTRFLSLKLSKVEFDKLCLRTIGRDGIPLHNQLIRSILRNASTRKVPIGNKKPSDVVYHQNGSIPVVAEASSPLILSNGDILSTSPRKARTGARERRGVDRRSALGPNGKTNHTSPSSSLPHLEDLSTVLDNGNSSSPNTRNPVQHHQQTALRSPGGLVAVHNKGQGELDDRKDGEGISGRISLHAPLGIPYCPVSVGGARRAPHLASSSNCVGVSDTNNLLATITLMARMESVAATQGLQGVSVDCANAVNNGLDAYLKGLMKSCCELNGALSRHKLVKNNLAHLRDKGTMQSSGWPLETLQEHEPKCTISLQDFRVAMELNPRQLGEDSPILLEKICTHASEE